MSASTRGAESIGSASRGDGPAQPASTGAPSARPPMALVIVALLVAGIMLLPLAYLLLRVLGSAEEAWELVRRPRVIALLLRTTAFAFVVTALSVILAVPLAWLTTRTDLPGRRAWSVLLALPLVIPTYVGGYVFVAALGPRGLLQQLLEGPFGVERLPSLYGFGGATLVLVLFTYPYVFLSARAALLRLDPSLEEAGRSLGYSRREVLLRVVLPQLRPAIAAGALLVALYALSDFGAVSLLQLETFTRAIYVQYQGSLDRSLAAALALMLALLTGAVLTSEVALRGRARYHRSTIGTPRAPQLVWLGGWRWAALALCGIVVLIALVLPIGVLGYWLVRGLATGPRIAVLLQAIGGSIQASALAALAAVVVAAPLAVLAVRYPGRSSALLERIAYVGFALPGIVIALSLVFFGANYAPWLYQTLAMLVLAYVVRFVPQALGAMRASLLQVSPHLEEAARSLGRTPWQVWREVTLPLVLPGVLNGAALVFLTTMKELPATLLLSPIGFRTLAVMTWSAAADGLFAEAAVPALLLVACSVPPLYGLIGRGTGPRREAV